MGRGGAGGRGGGAGGRLKSRGHVHQKQTRGLEPQVIPEGGGLPPSWLESKNDSVQPSVPAGGARGASEE